LPRWRTCKAEVSLLREAGAAATHKELAALLGGSRSKVGQLECYGRLPPSVAEIVNKKLALLGANRVQALSIKGFLEDHPDVAIAAVQRVANGHLRQPGMVSWRAP
jgi:hypothetical protein